MQSRISGRRWSRQSHLHHALRRAAIVAGLLLTAHAVVSAPAHPEGEADGLCPVFTLRNLDGDEVSLAYYHGRVVILEFWATWCDPCMKAFPVLHALQKAYAEQGAVLLVVCFDKSDDVARAFLVENGYTTDNVLWGSLAEARAVKELLGITPVTHAFVIDREGYIRYSGHPEKLTAEVLMQCL